MTQLLIENVQSYPRPPALERVHQTVRVILAGIEIANSDQAFRVLETHHAPTYYLPLSDILAGARLPAAGRSFCEWKGVACYWTVVAGEVLQARAAWSYPDPTSVFAALRDHVAFYASQMEACFVGELEVIPQPGDFYGGWMTPNLTGTIKGALGTEFW
ncbi:MAG: hypothetical protein ACI8TF_000686 [Paracoccaceae bacterium]|jgi:uncharacterized protein (DUF427 family)